MSSNTDKTIKQQAEIAILRAKLAETQKKLAETEEKLKKSKELGLVDDLTGCFNQNYYNKWVTDNFDQIRDDKRLGLAYFDVNDLKLTNDKLGHDAGDYLLVEFAKFLKIKLRKSDVVIRKGGDEFVAICLASSSDRKFESGLKLRIERIMKSCPISAAYGVAVYDAQLDEENIEKTIARADIQMYNNKKQVKAPKIYRKIGSVYKKIFITKKPD